MSSIIVTTQKVVTMRLTYHIFPNANISHFTAKKYHAVFTRIFPRATPPTYLSANSVNNDTRKI